MKKRKRKYRRDPDRKSATGRGSFIERKLSRFTDDAARRFGYFPLYVVYYTRTMGPTERVVPVAFSGMRSIAVDALEKLRSEAYEIRNFTSAGMWKEWHQGLPALQERIDDLRAQLPRGANQRKKKLSRRPNRNSRSHVSKPSP